MVGWEPYLFNWAAPPNNVVKGITQTVVVSEARARVATHARTLEESVLISDIANRLRALTKPLTDSISIPSELDQYYSYHNLSYTQASYILAVEPGVRIKRSNRSRTETVFVNESLSRSKSGVKAIGIEVTEPEIPISDVLTRLCAKAKLLASDESYLDISYSDLSYLLLHPDHSVVTDSVTFVKPIDIAKTVSDTVTIGEAVALLRTKIRTVIETTAISETLDNLIAKTRALNESTSGPEDFIDLEVQSAEASHVKSLIEDEAIGEDILTQAEKARTIDETTPILERLQGWANATPLQEEVVIPDVTNIIGAREFYVRPQAPRPPRFEYEVENTVYAPLKVLAGLGNKIITPVRQQYQAPNSIHIARIRTQEPNIGLVHTSLLTVISPNKVQLSLKLVQEPKPLVSTLKLASVLAQQALEPRKIINIERKYRTLKAYLLLHMVESLE